jgi:hypothetical protein
MWIRLGLLGVFALALAAPAQERRRPAELTVVEIQARHDGSVIQIDGRVKNVGQRRAGSVTLIVHVLAPGRQTLETREGPLDEDTVEPGEDALFSFETPFPARAIEVRLEAKDSAGRELRLNRAGPYRIE